MTNLSQNRCPAGIGVEVTRLVAVTARTHRAHHERVDDVTRHVLGHLGERPDLDDPADHVFVTFERAFILCRTTGDPSPMRRQLATLRVLLAALVARD